MQNIAGENIFILGKIGMPLRMSRICNDESKQAMITYFEQTLKLTIGEPVKVSQIFSELFEQTIFASWPYAVFKLPLKNCKMLKEEKKS